VFAEMRVQVILAIDGIRAAAMPAQLALLGPFQGNLIALSSAQYFPNSYAARFI
jgi:hypothetical protein